jgi:uncharacterized protein YqhQ
MEETARKGYSGIGGQAVLEGVMMKNGEKYAVAVRKPDGNLTVEVEHYSGITRGKTDKIPFVRGVVNFIDSLLLGMRTLNYSVAFYDSETEKGARRDSKRVHNDAKRSPGGVLVAILSVIIAVGIFVILPTYLATFFEKFVRNDSLNAIIEGVIRILILLIYLILISSMKDIRRIYAYHGAEHKCINCIERGRILSVRNVARSSRFHKRCGTSFIVLVAIVSVILFVFLRFDTLWLRMVIRVATIPVIAGISYEILRLAGRYDSVFLSIISAPGLWVQRITTREPDRHMIQTAIASVEAVFDWKAYLKEAYDYEVTDAMVREDEEEEDHIKINYKEDRDEFASINIDAAAMLDDDDLEEAPELDMPFEPDEDDWED